MCDAGGFVMLKANSKIAGRSGEPEISSPESPFKHFHDRRLGGPQDVKHSEMTISHLDGGAASFYDRVAHLYELTFKLTATALN